MYIMKAMKTSAALVSKDFSVHLLSLDGQTTRERSLAATTNVIDWMVD